MDQFLPSLLSKIPRDICFLSLISGYFLHLTLKSSYYPTAANSLQLLKSSLIVFFILTALSIYLSRFVIINSILLSLQTSTCFSLGFLTSLFVNRIFLAPISSYPGPFLAKLTKFWAVVNGEDGLYHKRVRKLFDEYDTDYLRIGPNELMTRLVF
jgi:hypothetical protein